MNMFLHEIRAGRKTMIIWTVSIVALIALFMLMFPSIEKDAAGFQKMLEGYPEAIRKGFGSAIENVTSILGFYSFIFVFVLLCGAIQAMILGTSILSKEARERTADFLLSKPVSRAEVMTAKLLAALTLILITNVISYAAAVISAASVHSEYNAKALFLINASLFLVQLVFMALGILISVFFQKLKSVVAISMGIVFGLFFVGMFLAVDKDDAARYFSPFKYFDTGYIIKNSSYEIQYLIVAITFVIAAVTASYIIYSRKDIHAVY